MPRIFLKVVSLFIFSLGGLSSPDSDTPNHLSDLLNEYRVTKAEATKDDLKELAVKLEKELKGVEANQPRLYARRTLANLYYDLQDFKNAEKSFAEVLKDSSDIKVHPTIELEASYWAYQSALYNGTPPSESMVYLDLFEQVFDSSSHDEDVIESFAYRRIQTNRYRAVGYENYSVSKFKELTANKETEKAFNIQAESIEKAIACQKEYLRYLNNEDQLYNQSASLQEMGWGREGSLYKLGQLQTVLASCYQNQDIETKHIRMEAVNTFEELLSKFPKKRFSQKGAALLVKEKAFLAQSPNVYLEYCKSIVSKVGLGYEMIHALREVMMQIASHSQWPGGVKWKDSGSKDAIKIAVEMADIIKMAIKTFFPEKYSDVNVLKHVLMLQTRYYMELDDLGKAIETFNELRQYGVKGNCYIELYKKLDYDLREFIGIESLVDLGLSDLQSNESTVEQSPDNNLPDAGIHDAMVSIGDQNSVSTEDVISFTDSGRFPNSLLILGVVLFLLLGLGLALKKRLS